jgi:hypothetical protein
MSTKLNDEQLAINRAQDLLWSGEMERAYAAAIREVAQPIADERDEYREALEWFVSEEAKEFAALDKGIGTALPRGKALLRYRAILAKYPKP